MRSSQPVQASTSLEIEVTLTGTYQPGYPETPRSFSSGGEPGEPASAEDIDIDGIAGLRWKPAHLRKSPRDTHEAIDLLTGVDRKSEAYKQIVQNIINFLGDEATEALVSEASE